MYIYIYIPQSSLYYKPCKPPIGIEALYLKAVATCLEELRLQISHAKTEATFRGQVKIIRERMLLKEKEISGEWLTKERMEKSGEYSKYLLQVMHRQLLFFSQS